MIIFNISTNPLQRLKPVVNSCHQRNYLYFYFIILSGEYDLILCQPARRTSALCDIYLVD